MKDRERHEITPTPESEALLEAMGAMLDEEERLLNLNCETVMGGTDPDARLCSALDLINEASDTGVPHCRFTVDVIRGNTDHTRIVSQAPTTLDEAILALRAAFGSKVTPENSGKSQACSVNDLTAMLQEQETPETPETPDPRDEREDDQRDRFDSSYN